MLANHRIMRWLTIYLLVLTLIVKAAPVTAAESIVFYPPDGESVSGVPAAVWTVIQAPSEITGGVALASATHVPCGDSSAAALETSPALKLNFWIHFLNPL